MKPLAYGQAALSESKCHLSDSLKNVLHCLQYKANHPKSRVEGFMGHHLMDTYHMPGSHYLTESSQPPGFRPILKKREPKVTGKDYGQSHITRKRDSRD